MFFRVLDKQGKAGIRRGLADSVERLRKAPKNDIPPILDVMRRQAADLAQVGVGKKQPASKNNPQSNVTPHPPGVVTMQQNSRTRNTASLQMLTLSCDPARAVCFGDKQVSGIDPLLAACLDRATEDIDRVVETIERRGDSGSGGGGGAPSVGSRVSKRSGMGSSRGKGSKRYARSPSDFVSPNARSFTCCMHHCEAPFTAPCDTEHPTAPMTQNGGALLATMPHSEPHFSPQKKTVVSPDLKV